jgi:hypothetical protein
MGQSPAVETSPIASRLERRLSFTAETVFRDELLNQMHVRYYRHAAESYSISEQTGA